MVSIVATLDSERNQENQDTTDKHAQLDSAVVFVPEICKARVWLRDIPVCYLASVSNIMVPFKSYLL